ncbi:MAG: hypothetical protein ACYTEP_06650 [Planctomycetota bacterium]|jgi:hypothetical protein
MADPITKNVNGVDVTIQRGTDPQSGNPTITYLAPPPVAGQGDDDVDINTAIPVSTLPFQTENGTCKYVSTPNCGSWAAVSGPNDVDIVIICEMP